MCQGAIFPQFLVIAFFWSTTNSILTKYLLLPLILSSEKLQVPNNFLRPYILDVVVALYKPFTKTQLFSDISKKIWVIDIKVEDLSSKSLIIF